MSKSTPLPRFYVPTLAPETSQAELPPDEARHLTRVMRLGAGDEIAVFDGRGRELRARVLEATRDAVRVTLGEPLATVPEAHTSLTLVQAVLKGDKMDEVVRDATMMGVAAIAPIVSARTIGKRQDVSRWERVAVSSAKQCRRAVIPRIEQVRSVTDWLATDPAELRLLFVEPTAAGGAEVSMRSLLNRQAASVAAIVGPEGGWTVEERDQMIAAGCTPVTLGTLTLRADAVPVVALAIVRFVLGA
jgi:16S rRNA (uracil1498-N3)-methyltransferase